MKKNILYVSLAALLLATGLFFGSFTKKTNVEFEFAQLTTVESVVPMGLGRSRMIAQDNSGVLEETKLENFFSAAGINFGNIRFNDKTVTDKVAKMHRDGWEMVSVNSGVYSGAGDSGGSSNNGIFITRYMFKRAK
jgi:hypothetical protein